MAGSRLKSKLVIVACMGDIRLVFMKTVQGSILFLIKRHVVIIFSHTNMELQNRKSCFYCHFFFLPLKIFLRKYVLSFFSSYLARNSR